MSHKRLFTEVQTADYIGMSRSFLRKARMNGSLEGSIPAPPFVRIGSRAIRYDKADLDAWIDQFPKCKHGAESK